MPVREPAYMHSFGLTERWFVLAEFPLVVNPLRLALSGRPYIENYRWKPELGTRFTLLDRETGERWRAVRDAAFFAFHHVNAYEERRRASWPTSAPTTTRRSSRTSTSTGCARRRRCRGRTLQRFRIDLGRPVGAREQLVDGHSSFRASTTGRCNERPYRYT